MSTHLSIEMKNGDFYTVPVERDEDPYDTVLTIRESGLVVDKSRSKLPPSQIRSIAIVTKGKKK